MRKSGRSGETVAVPRHLVLPAVRVQRKGEPSFLALWCPVCRCAHMHGDPAPSAVWTGRAHHYVDDRHRERPDGYSLLVIGKVRSLRSLPRISLDEALALTILLGPLVRRTFAPSLVEVASPPLAVAVGCQVPGKSRVLPAAPALRDA